MSGSPGTGALAVLFTPRATRELLESVRSWRKNRLEAPRLLDDEMMAVTARPTRRNAPQSHQTGGATTSFFASGGFAAATASAHGLSANEMFQLAVRTGSTRPTAS